MAFRKLKYEYHDASLVKFSVGPRREVTLEIALDPVWNKNANIVHIRFGNIKNFEKVEQFFSQIPTPEYDNAYMAEIIGLVYEKQKPYPIVIDISDYGDLKIEAGNVTET